MSNNNDSQLQQMLSSKVIVVDEQDNQISICDKYEAHHIDKGPKLHRAFSLFLFNSKGQLLIQQRSNTKLTFPLIWANTCCSHPEPNEDIISAAKRRTSFELNINLTDDAHLTEVGVFQYYAASGEWVESEIDHVIFGFYDNEKIEFNPDEINAVRWITSDELHSEIQSNPNVFSPWLLKIYDQWLSSNWLQWVTNKTLLTQKSDIIKL